MDRGRWREGRSNPIKLQYLGDRRDFYKYDLLLQLGRTLHLGLTVIPMLTPDDGSGQGRLDEYKHGSRDKGLWKFLRSPGEHGPREFGHVAEYLNDRGIKTRFVPEGYLEEDNRADYFARVAEQDLKDCIVFLDPDTGLKTPSASARNPKYLRYPELRDIYRRMSEGSVLVVYQHMPREPHCKVLEKLSQRLLSEKTQIDRAVFNDMGDIGFLLTTRS